MGIAEKLHFRTCKIYLVTGESIEGLVSVFVEKECREGKVQLESVPPTPLPRVTSFETSFENSTEQTTPV